MPKRELAGLLLAMAVILSMSSWASAATWITGVKVAEASAYVSGRNSIYMVKIEGDFASTGCAQTDNGKIISHIDGSHNPSAIWPSMHATAMLAQSQESFVDLLVGACQSSGGMSWEGIRVLQ